MAVLIVGVAGIVLVLGMTSEGHHLDAATQHFMLYYAGVFALIGLTASVGVGLVATDRVILTPGHRVMAQAVHRAVSFGALAFLIVHIVSEILAQRVHAIDAFVPFLSPFRTFYLGLGTIASDLILMVVITSIIRKRFTAHGKAWRWRAIHYTSYLSFVFGVWHGLMAGRSAKPYVDWTYGFAIALVAMGLMVRYLAISLRPKESLSVHPAKGGGSTSPLRAATLGIAQAQLGGTVQVLPTGLGAGAASRVQIGSSYSSGFMPLGAPSYGNGASYGSQAVASLPAPSAESRQPLYEPGYVGPPRYEGAPRGGTGPMPRVATGPMPRVTDSGPIPRVANSGPMPRLTDSGPMPRVDTGPMPRINTGPIPRIDTGPIPRINTGPIPRIDTGPIPRINTGPMRRAATGPIPRVGYGPMPQAGNGPQWQEPRGPADRSYRVGQRPGRQHQPDEYRYPADQYPPDQYPPDRYADDRYPADRYPADRYPADRYPADRYPADGYGDGRYTDDRYTDGQRPGGQHRIGQHPADRGQQHPSGPAPGSGRRSQRPEPGRARHRDQEPPDSQRPDSSWRGGDTWG
jgi:hypothetical protein